MRYDNFFYLKKFIELNLTSQNVLKKYNPYWIKCKSLYLAYEQKLHSGNDWNKWVRILGLWVVSHMTSCIGNVNEPHKWMYCIVGDMLGYEALLFKRVTNLQCSKLDSRIYPTSKKNSIMKQVSVWGRWCLYLNPCPYLYPFSTYLPHTLFFKFLYLHPL